MASQGFGFPVPNKTGTQALTGHAYFYTLRSHVRRYLAGDLPRALEGVGLEYG